MILVINYGCNYSLFRRLSKADKTMEPAAKKALYNPKTQIESSALMQYMEYLQTSKSAFLKGVQETKDTWPYTSLTTTAQKVRL